MRNRFVEEPETKPRIVEQPQFFSELEDYEGPTSLAVPVQTGEENNTPQRFTGAIQFVLSREVSVHTMYFALLLLSLTMYCVLSSLIVSAWDWLESTRTTGMVTIGLLYGALGILGIFEPLSEEEDASRLIDRFMRYVGAFTILMGLFLGGTWVTTQGILIVLEPMFGHTLSLLISLFLLSLYMYGLTATMVRLTLLAHRHQASG